MKLVDTKRGDGHDRPQCGGDEPLSDEIWRYAETALKETLRASWVVRGSALRFYFSGDTGYHEDRRT